MENFNSRHEDPSPLNEVETILDFLQAYYEAMKFGTGDDLMTEFRKIERAPGNQALLFANMLGAAESELRDGTRENFEPSIQREIELLIVFSALAHCADAMRPNLTRDQQWWSVCWAHSHMGRLRGSLTGELTGGMTSVIARAKGAAKVRHRENHEFKQEVFEWLTQNMHRFKSLNAAAEAIAGKVVPIKFTTARSWASEWKKIQSAGTL